MPDSQDAPGGAAPVNRADRPFLALTMGDPAGIGPEIVLKAIRDPRVQAVARCIAVGDAAWMQQVSEQLGLGVAVRPIHSVRAAAFGPDRLDVLDLGNVPPGGVPVGRVSAEAGRAAAQSVQAAATLAVQGMVDAIVTAPLNKEAMHLAGFNYPGHTELLAELTGTEDYSMLLISQALRVFFVTVHVSFRAVPDLITADRTRRVIEVAHRTLRRIGIDRPRLAVAGLNPHAGENGLFGHEEQEQIAPAIAAAQALGIDASGPWPPDTVFIQAVAGHFDAVVAMYHDQGHIPIKLLGLQEGVNVTAGLPIIRTSVDHGTAFDIAGRGIAEAGSMTEAVLLAARLVGAQVG